MFEQLTVASTTRERPVDGPPGRLAAEKDKKNIGKLKDKVKIKENAVLQLQSELEKVIFCISLVTNF